MSTTVNHKNIVHYARMEQWEKMDAVVADIEGAHVRQAFYMLCREGNAQAVERLGHRFQDNDRFVLECIAGGLQYAITLDTIKVLQPLLHNKIITDPEVLKTALRNPHSDAILECVIPWYAPDFLSEHRTIILTMVLKKVGAQHTRGFFALLERIGFSHSGFSEQVVNCTLEHLNECDQHKLMNMIGESGVRGVAQKLRHKPLTVAIIDAYCAVQQRDRVVEALDCTHSSRTRKI